MPFSNKVDSRNLLEHYKRIYNAKPTPEIARTRPSKTKRRGNPISQIQSSASFQSLYNPGSSLVSLHVRNPDVIYGSQGNLFNSSEGWFPDQRFPYSSSVIEPPNVPGNVVKRNHYSMNQRLGQPSFPNYRPSSAGGVQNFQDFNPNGTKSKMVYPRGVRYSSMENLDHKIRPNEENGYGRYSSQFSLDQFGIRPGTSLSERIDLFLQAVKFEEEKIMKNQQIQSSQRPFAKLWPPASSNISNTIRKMPASQILLPFKGRRSTIGSSQVKRPMTMPMATKVTPQGSSKIVQDRNYQPPRMKRQGSNNSSGGIPVTQSKKYQSGVKLFHRNHNEDFDEQDNNNYSFLRQKEDWLFDQYQRAEARQKAAIMIKRKDIGPEMASSKDSAYGYSGCETSKIHTREPTPDNHTNFSQGFPRRFSKHYLKQKHSLNMKNQSSSSQQFIQSKPSSKAMPLTKINTTFLKIISGVTSEILKSSNFTEHSIKRILETHLKQSKEKYNITKSEIEELFVTLKCELGLEAPKGRNGIQDLLILDKKNIPFKGREKVFRRGLSSTDSNHSNPILPNKVIPKRRPKQNIETTGSLSIDESEVIRLLKEETDLDDSLIEEILRASMSTNHNSSYQKLQKNKIHSKPSISETKRVKPQLIRRKGDSFLARDETIKQSETSIRAKSKSKEDPESNISRVLLYQSDGESKDISEDIQSGQDSDI